MSLEMPPPPTLESFEPSAATTREMRNALGRFATGVTVITCASEKGPLGITANSFASVSLDPAIVLWCAAKSSKRFEAFTTATKFAIHVMSDAQEKICTGFTKTGDAFDGYQWQTCEQGVPLISDCLSRFECTQDAVHDAGDHAIILGRVHRVSTTPGNPLTFYAGGFGGFA